jgi:hypothetical protein
VRFNGVGDFNPNFPERAIGRTFVCSDLTYALGGNRLLFKSKAAKSAAPEWYLVVISAAEYGRINFTSNVWKSVFSRVIAASQLRDKQEVMLLMKSGDWVQTSTGFWQLCAHASSGERGGLVRTGESVSP